MDETTEIFALKRANQFLSAMRTPNKRIGENKVSGIRKDYVPAPTPKAVQRFEQLNKEDRWCKVEFGPSDKGPRFGDHAHITVQDPADLGDIVLPHIIEE